MAPPLKVQFEEREEGAVSCDSFCSYWISNALLPSGHEGAIDTGPTAARVFTLLANGLSLHAAAKQVHAESGEHTAGCNPAHRLHH